MKSNEGKLVGGGREILKVCPICGREKLYQNRETGAFFCHKCEHKGRGSKSKVPKREDLPQLEQLELDLSGILSGSPLEVEPEKVEGTGLPEEFRPFFDGSWSVPPHLRGFMKDRGLTREDLLDWGLGTCLSGSYRGRLVFPVVTRGEVTFQARLTGGDGPKYLSPSGTKGAFVHAFDRVSMREGPVLICEGIFDAISIWRSGGVGVALLGKSLSGLQAELLKSLKRELIICLDGDAIESAKELSLKLDRASILRIPDSKDPDEFLKDSTLSDLLRMNL